LIQGAATCGRAAGILFDFRAAFPSVSHEFLLKCLKDIGLPDKMCRYLAILYTDNHCKISLRGGTFSGFDITAGIRQGCPLSPLLFAAIADLLLRRLSREHPTACKRAYADDLAMVLPSLWKALPSLSKTFEDYAHISGMALNIGKMVIIPLWGQSLEEVGVKLRTVVPEWAAVKVAYSAEYLGFYWT